MLPIRRICATAALTLLGSVAAVARTPHGPPEGGHYVRGDDVRGDDVRGDHIQTATADKAEALSEAARKGDAAAVKNLLDEGVDVNTKFRYDRTALSFACDRGNVEVVKVLLDRGADVNAKDTFYGATPLTWASSPAMARKPQHAEVVGLLLKHGAKGKESALGSAVSEGNAAMTKVILDSGGLDPNTLADALDTAKKGKHDDRATRRLRFPHRSSGLASSS